MIRSLDCYRDVPRTFRLWGSMFTTFNWGELFTGGLFSFGIDAMDWCVILVGVLIIWAVSRAGKDTPVRERLAQRPILLCFVLCLFTVLILLFGAYGIGYDASDFIYGQF